MLPSPTADPIAAKMKTLREEKPSLGLTSAVSLLDMLTPGPDVELTHSASMPSRYDPGHAGELGGPITCACRASGVTTPRL